MNRDMDRSKTLNELDPPAWGEPEHDSYLVATCHRLRNKPICEFTVEDLRIMIGQQIGLRFLVPVALEVLECNPLAEGDYYPGDLLASILTAGEEFWRRERVWQNRVQALLERLPETPEELDEAIAAFHKSMTQSKKEAP